MRAWIHEPSFLPLWDIIPEVQATFNPSHYRLDEPALIEKALLEKGYEPHSFTWHDGKNRFRKVCCLGNGITHPKTEHLTLIYKVIHPEEIEVKAGVLPPVAE